MLKEMIVGKIGILDLKNKNEINQSDLVIEYLWSKSTNEADRVKIDSSLIGKIDEYEQKSNDLQLFFQKSNIIQLLKNELVINTLDKN